MGTASVSSESKEARDISSLEEPDSGTNRSYYIALSGLLLLGFIVRAWELGRDSVWFDEAVSIGIAHLGWRDFFRAWAGEVNSGLYYLLVRALLPFGESEVFLRLTSVVTGVAAIAVFAQFVRRILGNSRAILTAFFLAINVSACFYVREIRGYAMLLLLISLAWLALERCLRDGRPLWFFFWAAMWIAAMYVHMFSVLVLAAQLLAVLFAPELGQRGRSILRSLLWIGIGYFPMAIMIYYSHRGQIDWIQPLSSKTSSSFFLELFGNSPSLLAVSVALFVGACILLAFAIHRQAPANEKFGIAVGVIGTIVPITLLALLSTVQPAFLARYAVQVTPTFALACAISISALPRKAWFPLLILLGALSFKAFRGFDLNPPPYEQRNDYRAAVAYIAAHAQPGDVIAMWGWQSRFGLEYYARRQNVKHFPSFVFPGTDDTPIAAEFASLPTVQYLDSVSAQHKRIWFFLDRDAPFKQLGVVPHFFLRRLGMGHTKVSETHYRNAQLHEFASE
jgi:mannosyltransferase